MQELENAMRKSSAQGTMFAKAVAEQAGISSSDMDCMDFLNMEGRMTAGRLAELTGLTTGAITGVVDRLEKAGFVRRVTDAEDRRRVVIQGCMEGRAPDLRHLFMPMVLGMVSLCETYTD